MCNQLFIGCGWPALSCGRCGGSVVKTGALTVMSLWRKPAKRTESGAALGAGACLGGAGMARRGGGSAISAKKKNNAVMVYQYCRKLMTSPCSNEENMKMIMSAINTINAENNDQCGEENHLFINENIETFPVMAHFNVSAVWRKLA